MTRNTDAEQGAAFQRACTEVESVSNAKDEKEVFKLQWYAMGYAQALLDEGLICHVQMESLRNSLDNLVLEKSEYLARNFR